MRDPEIYFLLWVESARKTLLDFHSSGRSLTPLAKHEPRPVFKL